MIFEIERDRVKLSKSAYYRYIRTVNNLLAYNGGNTINFQDFNYTFVIGFDNFLREIKKYHQNTIYKEHQLANQYLKRAAYMELANASKNPYLQFKPQKQATHVDVLYPSEISKIERLAFSDEDQHLEFYRDVFLFSVYSLLRISDVTSLSKRNITLTDKGLLYENVSRKTKKTNSVHRLPLYDLHRSTNNLSKPEQILKKYHRVENRPYFERSHVKLNQYIKVIVRKAGITKRVTFHTARHSGITWLVILGLELPHIQKLAQHSNITTTMQYVHLAEPIVGNRLSQVNWDKL